MYRSPIHSHIFAILTFLLLTSATQANDKPNGSEITLDGQSLRVRWSDGDSFKVLTPEYKDVKARITEFNTLESYGPVHRWGEWTAQELSENADQATEHVRQGSWTCFRIKDKQQKVKKDGYGRVLVSCPDLTNSLIAQGLAHLFFFDAPSNSEELTALQRQAQKAKMGMWKKGIPKAVLTSVHSGNERSSKTWTPYNRIVDTQTGVTRVIEHEEDYRVCEEVCVEDACMVYVPYRQRYGKKRPDCLRNK